MDVFAAVDVHAVAVGIDREVVDGKIVDAGKQEAEVAAFEDGKIAQDDVAAVLEGDGFVADPGLLGLVERVVAARGTRDWLGSIAGLPLGAEACGLGSARWQAGPGSEREPLAVDEPWAGDAEVVDVFSPQQ